MKTKKKRSIDSYLTGGSPQMMGIEAVQSGLLQLVDVLSNDPRAVSDQPIINATTARNMIDPYNNTGGANKKSYALGGDIGDIDESELQSFADENGLSIDELVAQLGINGEDDNTDNTDMQDDAGDDNTYGSGGWIKKAVNPKHKGYCTPMTKSTCTPRRKALARTFKKHHGFHAMGGYSGDTDEAGNPVEKKPSRFTSQKQINAANAMAVRFAKMYGHVDANNVHVASKIGDTMPVFAGSTPPIGKIKPKALSLPNNITIDDIQQANGAYWYNDPTTGDVVDVDSSIFSNPKYRKNEGEIATDLAARAAKKTMAYGGRANSNINVEDDEVLQTPTGKIYKMNGKTHEEGGIDVSVPKGTKIFSDRLKVDGKTMQERKLARERKLASFNRLIDRNPQDKILKASLRRTSENVAHEESKDMALQTIAKKIYDSPRYAVGGYSGDEGDDPIFKKFGVRLQDMNLGYEGDLLDPTTKLPTNNTTPAYTNRVPNAPITGPRGVGNPMTQEGSGVGVGDAIGIAGNLFNAVAPVINTLANRRATKPNINRFRGFGRKALQANDQAQGHVAGIRANAMTDIDTSANSSYARNRNSASSVGALRALDTTSDLVRNKARNATEDTFSKEMINILSQRAGLENEKDLREMTGETARDIEEQASTDNFHSNMAANLVNAGVNVQGIGRNLNQAKSNKTDKALISQLSKYGLTFDDEGHLINAR